MTALVIILIYLGVLITLGIVSNRYFRGASGDFFLASRTIGPVLLLLTMFGTTMTAFTLVGSTGEAYHAGVGVYGKLASWSGLVHSAVFYFIGVKLWRLGSQHGYTTQIQFFRDRFDSQAIGWLLFPLLVLLLAPYLLMGVLGAGAVVQSITQGALPSLFPHDNPQLAGGIPRWLTGAVICTVVICYVSFGGLRGATWANAMQTVIFILTALVAFIVIAAKLGGPAAATDMLLARHPEKLSREATTHIEFLTYCFIPLSIGMFPHVFQHWLSARSASSFKLAIVGHPLFMLLVWAPCVMLGAWATSVVFPAGLAGAGELVVPVKHAPNTQLAIMVQSLTSPWVAGLLAAGILAAIMSSLDSQFLCLGSMFTHDIVTPLVGADRITERKQIMVGRGFIVGIAISTWALSLLEPRQVFSLGVWCFTGFSALAPLVVAALYWRRATKAGAIASIAAAFVAWAWFFHDSNYGATRGYALTSQRLLPVVVIVAASAATLVIVSLLTKVPPTATLLKFFPASRRELATQAPGQNQTQNQTQA